MHAALHQVMAQGHQGVCFGGHSGQSISTSSRCRCSVDRAGSHNYFGLGRLDNGTYRWEPLQIRTQSLLDSSHVKSSAHTNTHENKNEYKRNTQRKG